MVYPAIPLVTAGTCFVASWAELRFAGPDWLSGEVLLNHIAHDTVRKDLIECATSPLGRLVLSVPWILGPLAWLTMLVEQGAKA